MPEKISRRHFFAQAGGVGVGIMLAPAAVHARQTASVSKEAAIYRPAGSGRQVCADCRLFLPARSGGSSRCNVVEGPIEEDGVCVLWEQGKPVAARGGRL